MWLARWCLMLSAVAYGFIGVTFLVAPAEMASFVDVSLGSATADNDIRAVYGGVALGLALFFGAAVHRGDWAVPALWVAALTLACMAGARFVSWAVAGPPAPLGYLLHSAEFLGSLASLIALRRLA
jgi:hypothetical protein